MGKHSKSGTSCTYHTAIKACDCRDLNRLDNAKSAKATDALLNYETVKYFSNEELERRNFEEAIRKYQKVEYTLIASLNGLNVLQSVIIWSGMIGGLIVCTEVSFCSDGLRHFCYSLGMLHGCNCVDGKHRLSSFETA